MGTIIKFILVVVMILVIGWGGLCVYGNTCGRSGGPVIDMPKNEKATHSVYIENTGNLLLTSNYEIHGSEVGKRTFVLHGFWEVRGNDFEFVNDDIILKEAIFGKITIRRRQ